MPVVGSFQSGLPSYSSGAVMAVSSQIDPPGRFAGFAVASKPHEGVTERAVRGAPPTHHADAWSPLPTRGRESDCGCWWLESFGRRFRAIRVELSWPSRLKSIHWIDLPAAPSPRSATGVTERAVRGARPTHHADAWSPLPTRGRESDCGCRWLGVFSRGSRAIRAELSWPSRLKSIHRVDLPASLSPRSPTRG